MRDDAGTTPHACMFYVFLCALARDALHSVCVCLSRIHLELDQEH
jgi:hypothetical protein